MTATQTNGRILSDEQIIERASHAKNGGEFSRLMAGDMSGYGYDESRADAALCAHLAFWTRDPQQIDRIFRSSGLMRDKWDRRLREGTYGSYTIAKELGFVTQHYDPTRNANGQRPRTPAPERQQTPAARPSPAPQPAPQPVAEPWRPSTSEASFISRYVAYASSRTDAPPEAHELMAVGILSALVGPEVRLPIATTVRGWKLNIWGLYIVDSTVGRKSTVLDYAKEILEPLMDGARPFIEWEGSPQGFIQRLQDRDGKTTVLLRDEMSGLLQQINRGGSMSGMMQMLIRAYDGRTVENIRVRKLNANGKAQDDTDRANDPYLVGLTASTRESFVERVTIDNVIDGFLARFVIVTGHAEAKPMVEMTAAIMARRSEVTEHAKRFQERAASLADLALPREVMAAAWETEQAWIKEAEHEPHAGAMAATYKRLADTTLKIAGLIAIDEGESPTIELAHYRAAKQMAERWRICARDLIEELGQTPFRKLARRVAETVAYHPQGIKRGELFRKHRSLKKREFDEMIDSLLEQGDIDEQDAPQGEGGGRPTTLIFPTARLRSELGMT